MEVYKVDFRSGRTLFALTATLTAMLTMVDAGASSQVVIAGTRRLTPPAKVMNVTARKPLYIHGSTQPASAQVLTVRPDFISTSVGFIADLHGLLQTRDGGTTWNRINTPHGTVQGAAFTSEKDGWVLMAEGSSDNSNTTTPEKLYRTTDGGTVWKEALSGQTTDTFWPGGPQLQTIGQQTVLLLMNGVLHKSADGGRTWLTLGNGNQYVKAATFTSMTAGFMVTVPKGGVNKPTRYTVWSTGDGGRSWSPRFRSRPEIWSNVELAVHGQRGVVLTFDTQKWETYLTTTSNGGKTWSMEKKPVITGRVFAQNPVFESSSRVLLPAGGGAGPLPSSMLESTNGGLTFKTMPEIAYWRGLSLSRPFGNTIYGIATAGNGQELLKSTDSGQSWSQVYPRIRPQENISFVSPTKGFGLGTATNPEAVLATNDAGHTWKVIGQLPQGLQIGTLTFRNSEDGWAVANQPRAPRLQIYRTLNGGRVWSPVKGGTLPKDTRPVLSQMGIIDPVTFAAFSPTNWVIGANGYPQLYTFGTRDAGATFIQMAQMADPPGSIEALSFASPSDGWMSVLRTPKSGVKDASTTVYRLDASAHAWRAAWDVPGGVAVQGMARVGSKDAWLVGTQPWVSIHQKFVVLCTTNGGRTWTDFTSTTPEPLDAPNELGQVFELSFVNARDGWLLTSEGLYETHDGGQTWTNTGP